MITFLLIRFIVPTPLPPTPPLASQCFLFHYAKSPPYIRSIIQMSPFSLALTGVVGPPKLPGPSTAGMSALLVLFTGYWLLFGYRWIDLIFNWIGSCMSIFFFICMRYGPYIRQLLSIYIYFIKKLKRLIITSDVFR